MGFPKVFWQDWLNETEAGEWKELDRAMNELKDELLVLKARRDALRTRAMNRRYVANRRV